MLVNGLLDSMFRTGAGVFAVDHVFWNVTEDSLSPLVPENYALFMVYGENSVTSLEYPLQQIVSIHFYNQPAPRLNNEP